MQIHIPRHLCFLYIAEMSHWVELVRNTLERVETSWLWILIFSRTDISMCEARCTLEQRASWAGDRPPPWSELMFLYLKLTRLETSSWQWRKTISQNPRTAERLRQTINCFSNPRHLLVSSQIVKNQPNRRKTVLPAAPRTTAVSGFNMSGSFGKTKTVAPAPASSWVG